MKQILGVVAACVLGLAWSAGAQPVGRSLEQLPEQTLIGNALELYIFDGAEPDLLERDRRMTVGNFFANTLEAGDLFEGAGITFDRVGGRITINADGQPADGVVTDGMFSGGTLRLMRSLGADVVVTGIGGGGMADGVATAGVFDSLTNQIDFSVLSPGADFSVDVSGIGSGTSFEVQHHGVTIRTDPTFINIVGPGGVTGSGLGVDIDPGIRGFTMDRIGFVTSVDFDASDFDIGRSGMMDGSLSQTPSRGTTSYRRRWTCQKAAGI